MHHELKILPEFFEAWKRGEKTCELRKDDRLYSTRDTLRLREAIVATGRGHSRTPVYTGQEITVRVLGILRGHEGLAPGYCLMSCEEIKT